MTWKSGVNTALRRLTGYTLTKGSPLTNAAVSERTPRIRKVKVARADLVRPPADPEHDRLLRRPVFVMAPVRSGSTLLRYLLDAHSLIHAPHELHVRRLAVVCTNRLSKMAMEELGHNQADLEHLLWDRVLHRELVRSGKTIIVDKTSSNAFAFERIAACWPDPRFIFLIRHPQSIAQSWAEASPERRNAEDAMLNALRYMGAVERARQALDGMTVRYEDITTDPEEATRRICAYLEVPWEPQMLTYDSTGVFKKGLGDWKDKIQSGSVQPGRKIPRPQDVAQPLRDIAERWGYL
jgi:Sulfotransferase family